MLYRRYHLYSIVYSLYEFSTTRLPQYLIYTCFYNELFRVFQYYILFAPNNVYLLAVLPTMELTLPILLLNNRLDWSELQSDWGKLKILILSLLNCIHSQKSRGVCLVQTKPDSDPDETRWWHPLLSSPLDMVLHGLEHTFLYNSLNFLISLWCFVCKRTILIELYSCLIHAIFVVLKIFHYL